MTLCECFWSSPPHAAPRHDPRPSRPSRPSVRPLQLYVHGVCHLIGHDHEDDADFERMQAVEEEVLRCVRCAQV